MSNINRTVISGNLTRDPELRETSGGKSVCNMRVAVNTRRKDASGEWVDKPNYFDVTVWGAQGENCATYLKKGRAVAVDGRLDWREWQADDGSKRQAVSIIAENIQFLGGGANAEPSATNGAAQEASPASAPAPTAGAAAPADAAMVSDDDIPF